MTGAFVCFLDSYLLFFLFGLSNSLRIRGYLIKYSRIFHHVSVDISLRIHGYAKFLLCLRGLLVVCFWFFSYCCSFWLTRISRKTRSFLSSLDFWSHTDLTKWAASQKAHSLLTLPLFIEGVRRSREGVPNGVSRNEVRSNDTTRYACNAPALTGTPSINRGGVGEGQPLNNV